jgi:hypothetical protein
MKRRLLQGRRFGFSGGGVLFGVLALTIGTELRAQPAYGRKPLTAGLRANLARGSNCAGLKQVVGLPLGPANDRADGSRAPNKPKSSFVSHVNAPKLLWSDCG